MCNVIANSSPEPPLLGSSAGTLRSLFVSAPIASKHLLWGQTCSLALKPGPVCPCRGGADTRKFFFCYLIGCIKCIMVEKKDPKPLEPL